MNSRESAFAVGGSPNLTLTGKPLHRSTVQPSDLRVALFSGNYNYVRDGANQALNRLSGYLQGQGAKVRIYSPKSKTPAFPSTGKVIGVPSIVIPGRTEYRMPLGISPHIQRDLMHF